MASHTTTKSLKIKHNKSIGTVIIVVEGAVDERELLKKIFSGILHYRFIHMMRGAGKASDIDKFVSRQNERDKVIVINTQRSCISSIKEFEQYRNIVYKDMSSEYGIDFKNSPVFYLWDRDAKNNNANVVRSLLCGMGSPYDNEYFENGLLLLSYPALEAYRASCYWETSQMVQNNVRGLKKALGSPWLESPKISFFVQRWRCMKLWVCSV